MGKYSAHLVGESNYQTAVARLRVGDPVRLLPEPTNPHDPRAIKAVTTDNLTIGYVERESWLTGAMLDQKVQIASCVLEIIGGGPGQMRGVVLDVRTAKDAIAALAGQAPAPIAPLRATGGVPPTGLTGGAKVVLAVVAAMVIAGVIMSDGPTSNVVSQDATEAASDAAEAASDAAVAATEAATAAIGTKAIAAPASAADEPASSLNFAELNAARAAEQYLSTQSFSRKGLIHQLSSDAGEGYELADAEAAVTSLTVDWNDQAARSARQYLQTMAFSCKGLIHQLSSSSGEQFTVSQATYAAKAAGAC